jgi:hypothetical protein
MLLRRTKRLLYQHGLPWERVLSACTEVVVFGSSVQKERTGDLDLFLVGFGRRAKTRKLDLVWKTPAQIKSRRWLESELANHIAAYGIWLAGTSTWVNSVRISAKTVRSKRQLIVARANALERAWPTLNAAYRLKHVVKLRRDLQRLHMLSKGKPVPPSPKLDSKWRLLKDRPRAILSLAHDGRLLTSRQKALFSKYWKVVRFAP